MFQETINGIRDELAAIYKDLHQHPEPGYTERRTAGIVAEYLRRCGLPVTEGVALNGVVGVLDSGKPGKTLMMRADMDCLRIQELTGCDYQSQNEGCMHACGHDSHVTMLLGAAKVLSQHTDAFSGKIKFLFQPAEEQIDPSMEEAVRQAGYDGAGGAGFMIQEGALDGVDACVIMHCQPAIPFGTVQIAKRNACASSDLFDVTFVGKGGHGARPHEAIDPVPAMAEAIQAIHALPTREVSCLETCVISVGEVETPGSVWNAVAEKARFVGGFRTFNPEVRALLGRRIPELAETIAKAHRCRAEIRFLNGYMPCLNDERVAQAVAQSCREVLGEDCVDLTDTPAMTSEDAGEYLARVPGAFFWLGAGDPEHTLHNPYFLPSLDMIPLGVRVHVNNAVTMLARLNGAGL